MTERASTTNPAIAMMGPTRPYWRDPLSIVLLGVLLSACMTRPANTHVEGTASASAVSAESPFEEYEVVIESATRPTVLTGFLLDGAIADLAVVHIDPNEDRRLHIYAFEDATWVQRLDRILDPGVLFVDVADIGGRDRLVTYAPGRLNWLDPESGTEYLLMAVTSSFRPPRIEEIPHVDLTRDLNDDNLDDVVVPDVDGFWVSVQTAGGTFADPVKIGRATDMSGISGSDGYRYAPWSESRIHEVDYNRDGRSDLVFWNEDHFAVHAQDARGLFGAEARTFTTDVAFDSDDLFSLATGSMTGRVLHSLRDINGDGISDLVVVSLEGTSIGDKRSTYEVNLGTPTPDGGTAFPRGVDTVFRSEGSIQLAMEGHDLDRDGQLDLMFTTIEVDDLHNSLWKTIKGFMGDDIRLGLEFYRSEQGRYPDTPTTIRRIALDGVPSHREPGSVDLDIVLRGPTHERRKTQQSWPRAFNSTLLIGDVTGDGISDLIIGQHPRYLGVFIGVEGPDLFSQQPQNVAVAVPNDEEYIWLVDLDRDGRQDILMHHPFTLRDAHGAPTEPPGTEPHRVTILIAR